MLVRLVDDRAIQRGTQLRHGAVPVVDPDLHEVRSTCGELPDRAPRVFLARHAVGNRAHREVPRRRIRRREATACRPEERPRVRLVPQSVRQLTRIGAGAHHRHDAVIQVAIQVIDDVLARVVVGGERQALQIADVPVQRNDARNYRLAGKVDPGRTSWGSNVAAAAHGSDASIFDEDCSVLDRRTAIADDHPGTLQERGARCGLRGVRPDQEERNRRQSAADSHVNLLYFPSARPRSRADSAVDLAPKLAPFAVTAPVT